MKKIAILSFVFIQSISFSQLGSYKKYINGSFNFNLLIEENSNNNLKNDKSVSSSIGSRIGFMRSEKTALGVGFSINHTFSSVHSNFNNVITENNSQTYGVGLEFFLRRFNKLNEQFYFTLTYGLGLNGSRNFTKQTFVDSAQAPLIYTYHSGEAAKAELFVFPTIMFFPKPSWAIEASFGRAFYSFGVNSQSNLEHRAGLSLRTSGITFGLTKFF